jgi:hypothetical protein
MALKTTPTTPSSLKKLTIKFKAPSTPSPSKATPVKLRIKFTPPNKQQPVLRRSTRKRKAAVSHDNHFSLSHSVQSILKLSEIPNKFGEFQKPVMFAPFKECEVDCRVGDGKRIRIA